MAGIFRPSGEKTIVLVESEPEPVSEPAAGWVPSLPQAASVIQTADSEGGEGRLASLGDGVLHRQLLVSGADGAPPVGSITGNR